MAHKIFGQRFISRVEPAWHGLGICFPADEDISPSDAVKRVAGDVQVVKVPMFYRLPGAVAESMSDSCVIVRLPTRDDAKPAELGITSERWEPTSYVELAMALDKMDRSVYRIETAGLLSDGALCFFSLRGQDWSVLGKDEMRSYFLVNLSLTPGVGHRVADTPIRVVCANTNTVAIASSNIQLRIPHGADAAQQIGLAGDLIARFKKAQEETKRIFDAMASTPAPQESVDKIFGAAFPLPEMPGKLRLLKNVVGEEGAEMFRRSLDPAMAQSLFDAEERFHKSTQRVRELREAAGERNDAFEPAELRGTVWSAYNACTEVSDWRGDGKTAGESTLVGVRGEEKVRAFGAALELVK